MKNGVSGDRRARPQALPANDDEPYDAPISRRPAAAQGGGQLRDLDVQLLRLAHAALRGRPRRSAYGLPWEDALRAITINPGAGARPRRSRRHARARQAREPHRHDRRSARDSHDGPAPVHQRRAHVSLDEQAPRCTSSGAAGRDLHAPTRVSATNRRRNAGSCRMNRASVSTAATRNAARVAVVSCAIVHGSIRPLPPAQVVCSSTRSAFRASCYLVCRRARHARAALASSS